MSGSHANTTITRYCLQCLEVGRVVHHTGGVINGSTASGRCRQCPADNQLVLLLGERHSLWRLPRRTADIACDLAQVTRKKVDGVLICKEHATGRPGHHHLAEGGCGQDGPRVGLIDSPSQQVEEDYEL